jgi:hypothetical protein
MASRLMPLSYTIDRAQRLITIEGEYAHADEWRELLRRVYEDPQREAGFGFLRDLRGAKHPVDAAAVLGIMNVVRHFWPLLQPGRAAVLTPREFDAAALTAHAIADAEHLPLKVFSAYDDAIEWLQSGTGTTGTKAP